MSCYLFLLRMLERFNILVFIEIKHSAANFFFFENKRWNRKWVVWILPFSFLPVGNFIWFFFFFFTICWLRIITKIFWGEKIPSNSQFIVIYLHILHFSNAFFVKKISITLEPLFQYCIKKLSKTVSFCFQNFKICRLSEI